MRYYKGKLTLIITMERKKDQGNLKGFETDSKKIMEKNKICYVDGCNKESARATAKRFIKSGNYDGKSYFYKVMKEGNRLIILNDKGIEVYPNKKEKITEAEYNFQKEHCKKAGVIFPLPKTYYLYLSLDLKTKDRGFY